MVRANRTFLFLLLPSPNLLESVSVEHLELKESVGLWEGATFDRLFMAS